MKINENKEISAGRGWLAVSPVLLFLGLYLMVSLITGDFYKMPMTVAMVVASAWGIVILRGKTLKERLEIFSRSAAHSDIIYMIWIFILAGGFASIARSTGAVEATVSACLGAFPADWIVPGIFAAACVISMAIGTSVGTVVALAPLAVEIAGADGGSMPFYIAVVLGGSFFGDNLSFISDTTIAATRSQGCELADKFKVNVWLALPAAIITLVLYAFLNGGTHSVTISSTRPLWLVTPYVVVIVTALFRMNVTVVLGLGILTAVITGLADGKGILNMTMAMGEGIEGMGSLIIITLLASGMLGVIKEAGGIRWILQCLTRRISGRRGAQVCIAVLTALVNLCTANNTVTIITVGKISREISERYGVDPRKSASLLDTSSCIVQCLIPYGAQTLLATSLAGISPVAPFQYLYYPWILSLMTLLSIIFLFPRSRRT